jgi:hypothetical protein
MDPDTYRIMDWVEDISFLPPSFNVIVEGDRSNEPIAFTAFGCLYPEKPLYRLKVLPGVKAKVDGRAIKTGIAKCRLPWDAERRFERWWRREGLPGLSSQGFSADECWGLPWGEAVQARLPIGMYGVGKTLASGEDRAILWMLATASPTRFLRELKAAAR